ncbi:MAG: hypothetical protein H6739_38995 [Alphaproteobacteria bacterium]|nr:hypothetical protein [Alphaproteobacteria bacterium]
MGEPTVYDVLDAVRARPWMCLHEHSVRHLATFWGTYQWTLRQYDLPISMGTPDFRHFGMWVAARRDEGLHTGGWQHFLTSEEGADGWGSFFEELDEFRRHRLHTVARAALPTPRIWPVYTSRPGLQIVDGEMKTPETSEVVEVELRAYLPEEAFFLIAICADGSETERWCWTRSRAEHLAATQLGVKPDQWMETTAEP